MASAPCAALSGAVSVKIGAENVLLPECGLAHRAARWYGAQLTLRVLHMTEHLAASLSIGRLRVWSMSGTAIFSHPFQIVRRGGLEAPARRLLAALGFEWGECAPHGTAGMRGAGGGGVSSQRAAPLRHHAFALEQAPVEAAGAERFVTSRGHCRTTLEIGAKRARWTKRRANLRKLAADHRVE